MKKLTAFITVLFISIALFAQSLPRDVGIVDYIDKNHSEWFIIGFDYETKNPAWVCYSMDVEMAETSKGKNQKRPNWKTDADIPGKSSTDADYKNSGYDRGHMATYDHFCCINQQAAQATMLMSNIIPQTHKSNAGLWLNKYENGLVKIVLETQKTVFRICGPVYSTIYHNPNDKCEKIGKSKVHVPIGFFNIFYLPNGEIKAAIVYQNNTDKELSLDELESMTGLRFDR